jgi:hypothetical protein
MPMPREGTTEWFRKTLTWANKNGSSSRPLATALVNRTEAYAAVETTQPDGTRDVWAAVFMLKYNPKDRDGYTFGYKDMDETCGPNIDNCPAKILDLLTPTTSEWANQWRARCRQRIERRQSNKVISGDIIKFDHELGFGGYGSADTFKVRTQGRSVFFHALDSETLESRFACRITGWRDRTFTKIDPADVLQANPKSGM